MRKHDATLSSLLGTSSREVPVGRGIVHEDGQETKETWRQILGLDLAVGIVACLLMAALRSPDHSGILPLFARALAIGFFIGTPIAWFFKSYAPAVYRFRFPLNWLLVIAVILVCAFLGTLLFNLVCLGLGLVAPGGFWPAFWPKMRFSAILAMVFGIGGFGYRMLRYDLEVALLELKDRELAQERAQKLMVEAQLASLESHVRPHFLFNALNTISSLIPENPKRAEALVEKLAALLRQSLDSNHERLVSLDRELKLVSDYVEIERARFGDRLRFRLEIADGLPGMTVPALALQTLVENSVKHAVALRLEGAEISLAARAEGECLRVEVSDDGPGFTFASLRPGHGLENLRQRLAALFGPEGKMDVARRGKFTVVSLSFPRAAGPSR
ncbi:MAG TPA: histidine kinase [Opitutaceae bacterium]|nr:histidine kinase [Opitutaceae bacterium]